MKLHKFLIASIFSILLSGCTDGNSFESEGRSINVVGHYISISQDKFNLAANEGSSQFNIECMNASWELTGMDSWLKLSPVSGSSNSTITYTAEENISTTEARTCVVTLSSTNSDFSYRRNLTFTQSAAVPHITPETKSVLFSAAKQQRVIAVDANVEWTPSVESSATWLHATVSSDKKQVTLEVDENTTGDSRSAKFYLQNDRAGTYIIVSQAVATDPSISQEEIDVVHSGGNYTLSITSEIGWVASTTASWVSVPSTEFGSGTQSIQIQVQANTTWDERSATINIKSLSGHLLKVITIKQGGNYLRANPSNLTFTANRQTLDVNIESNQEWNVLRKPDWIIFDKESGTGDMALKVTAESYEQTVKRTGNIVFGISGTYEIIALTVEQMGRTFDNLVAQLNFELYADQQVVDITTDGSWTASSEQTWIHVSPSSGNGNSQLTVSVDENTGDSERVGSVSVTVGSTVQTIVVLQKGRYFTIDTTTSDALPSTGGSHKIHITTAETWTAQTQSSWIALSQSSGQGDIDVTITAADNPSLNERTDTTIFTPQYSQQVKVYTKQSGKYLRVSPATELEFFVKGGTSEAITIETDGTYSIAANQDWILLHKTGNTFTIEVSEYEGETERIGKVVVSMTNLPQGESYEVEINVQQYPYSYGEVITVNGVSFNMIRVKAGTFQMGSTIGDDEKPVHSVTLTNDYFIGETEVTQELWEAVMGSNPSNQKGSKHPVESVSWDDCQTFITKLNQLTGKTFRLPTEAEWEFAARGGNKSNNYFYSGSDNIDEVAWYYSNSGYSMHDVATKAPNELGIYDMSGNVWEWCQDWYGSSYYQSSPSTNPTGPASGSNRVLRGGSWGSSSSYCRSAGRQRSTPSRSDSNGGFRLAL